MSRSPLRTTALLFAASVALLSSGCAPQAGPVGFSSTTDAPPPAAVTSDAPSPDGTDPGPAATPQGPGGAAATPEGAAVPQGGPGIVLRPASDAQVATTVPPSSLDIEGTDIDVEVIEVGLADDDEMEIPSSFYEAGWYRYGPAPGAPAGNAVLAAHIDIGTEEMPFAQLKDVAIGTIVTVGRQDADPVRYRVTEVRNEPKASLDTEELFRRDGDHQLVVVTCGGAWLEDRQDYEDNVILTASPI